MTSPATITRIDLSATVPAVTAHVWPATDPDAPVVVLAHGAGSRIDHPVHQAICAAVADAGCPVVAFNFSYAEAGRRSPDRTERLLACWADVAAWVGAQFPGRPIVGGGRSMGGRMASMLAAQDNPFSGLALLNYPLLGIRRSADSPPRTDHWPQLALPVLFVHGTRDRLCPLDVFEQQRSLLPGPVTVHVIDDADHSFAVRRQTGRDQSAVFAEVGTTVARWANHALVAP